MLLQSFFDRFRRRKSVRVIRRLIGCVRLLLVIVLRCRNISLSRLRLVIGPARADLLVDELLQNPLFRFPAERTALVRPLLAGEDLLGALAQLAQRLEIFRQVGIRVEPRGAGEPREGVAVQLRVGEIVGALETLALVQQALGETRPEARRRRSRPRTSWRASLLKMVMDNGGIRL